MANPEKPYRDCEGYPCTLEEMCRREPEWMCSQFRQQRAELEKLRAALDSERLRRVDPERHERVRAELAWAQREIEKLRHALTTIEYSGAPGGSIVAKRSDGHACGWCRGMLTPCPVSTATQALSPAPPEHRTDALLSPASPSGAGGKDGE